MGDPFGFEILHQRLREKVIVAVTIMLENGYMDHGRAMCGVPRSVARDLANAIGADIKEFTDGQ
jgi:hypothetical protein